jgi:hypothetical protein
MSRHFQSKAETEKNLMYVKIHARDADCAESPGKSTVVDTPIFSVKAVTYGMGQTRLLEISASDTVTRGTGSRGGEIKTIDRELSLLLSELDLRKIIDQAVAAKMLTAPGFPELLAGYEALSEGLRRLNLIPMPPQKSA